MSFFRLSEHSDVWVQGKYDLHLWSSGKMCDLCCFRRASLWRPCSQSHLRVCCFLSWPCRQVSEYIYTRVCVCVCVRVRVCVCARLWIFHFDTMHKTLYCKKKSIHVFFNCASTEFSCCRMNGLLCVLFLLINYSYLTTALSVQRWI